MMAWLHTAYHPEMRRRERGKKREREKNINFEEKKKKLYGTVYIQMCRCRDALWTSLQASTLQNLIQLPEGSRREE